MGNDREIQLSVRKILKNLGATNIELTTVPFSIPCNNPISKEQKTCRGDFSAMLNGKSLGGEALTGSQTGKSLLKDQCQISGIVQHYNISTVAGPTLKKNEINEYLRNEFNLEISNDLGNDVNYTLWQTRVKQK